MKKIIAILLVALLCFSIVGCAGQKSEAETFNVGTLKGPSALGMLGLLDDQDELLDGTTKINYTIAAVPDEIVAKLLSGELDAACVPMNVAPVLYNKTNGGFVITSVHTLGTLYILENGSTITNINDLKGKTIYASGKGSTPEYILSYLLQENGLKIGVDVNVEYLNEHAAVSAKLVSEEGAIGMLPEPFVTTTTTKSAGRVNVSLDLTKVWEETTPDSQLMMTAFVVNKEYAEANSGTVNLYLKEYEKSVKEVLGDVDNSGELAKEYGIIDNEEVAKKAIPNCNIVFLKAIDNKDAINNLFEVFASYNPQSIGGSIPGEDFYFNAK